MRISDWSSDVCSSDLEHRRAGGNAAHVEDLAPAIAEPAIADDQALLVRGELPRDRFHAEGAAAGHDNGAVSVVDLFQGSGDVFHDLLKGVRHMIYGAIGVDPRKIGRASCREGVCQYV